jgi:hypothetical protein
MQIAVRLLSIDSRGRPTADTTVIEL